MGPLVADAANPRYFRRPDGRFVALRGIHTWTNLQDIVTTVSGWQPFDDAAFLDFLVRHYCNFDRLWAWEGLWGGGTDHGPVSPLPYARTGPGVAIDGGLRLDLDQFNQAYFDRVRQRVQARRARGIWCSVMLFQGWGVNDYGGYDAYAYHWFNPGNNIQGVDSGSGPAVHHLGNAEITSRQEAYIRKLVDTLNDLDNFVWEISNEENFDGPTQDWITHIIGYLRSYEATKPVQHPVGVTGGFEPNQTTINQYLYSSGADWISITGFETHASGAMPEPETDQVSILDTDHVFGTGGDYTWPIRAFLHGHNPIYMSNLRASGIAGRLRDGNPSDPEESGHAGVRAVGAAADLLGDVAGMAPHDELSSQGWCLAEPGRKYCAWVEGGGVTLDLGHPDAVGRTFDVVWVRANEENPALEIVQSGGTVQGGAQRALSGPFSSALCVVVRREMGPSPPPPGTGSDLQAALDFVAPLTVGVNVERGRAFDVSQGGLMSAAGWSYLRDTVGLTHVRLFYPHRLNLDMLGEGTQNPSEAQFGRILDAAAAAIAAGLKVFLDCLDVIEANEVTGSNLAQLQEHISNCAGWIAARNFDPSMLCVGPVNEWAGDEEAVFAGVRQDFHDRLRAALPNHVILHGGSYWKHYTRLLGWQGDTLQPLADKRVIYEVHSYETHDVEWWAGLQQAFDDWSAQHGVAPVVYGEAGPGTMFQDDQSDWVYPDNIRTMAQGLPRARIQPWAITTGNAWLLNQPDGYRFKDGTGWAGQPNIEQAMRDAEASVRAALGL